MFQTFKLSIYFSKVELMQLMERRGYGGEYIERYKMMTRFVA